MTASTLLQLSETGDFIAFRPQTFRFVNEGPVIHDLHPRDVATRDQHEEEMADLGGMAHEQVSAVTLAAEETNEITWTLTQAGTVVIGCH